MADIESGRNIVDLQHVFCTFNVLSTDLYKLYINPLLDQIEDSDIGMQIGTIPCSAPTCADDVSLIADSEKKISKS